MGAKNGSFVRNSESCQHYYYCDAIRMLSGKCPDGRLFNAVTESCDPADGVDCLSCSRTGIQFIKYQFQSEVYYQCINGGRYLKACPDHKLFSTGSDECRYLPPAVNEPTYKSLVHTVNFKKCTQ